MVSEGVVSHGTRVAAGPPYEREHMNGSLGKRSLNVAHYDVDVLRSKLQNPYNLVQEMTSVTFFLRTHCLHRDCRHFYVKTIICHYELSSIVKLD